MPSPDLFQNNPRVRIVSSFEELVDTRFRDGVNALCWPRVLEGDFADIIAHLDMPPGITHLSAEELRALPLSAAGKAAVEIMITDQERLSELGLDPVLDCVNGYVQREETGPVRTDVCSFHVDSATAEADTWLCTYHGASSEGLLNEEAIGRALIRETRAELLRIYGGSDDEGFAEWLNDHFYDLHYAPLPEAKPYTFGVGNLWRIATEYPDSPVPPCIHRAPDPIAGQKRLLLIS